MVLALDYWTGCVSVEVHHAGVGGVGEPDSVHVVGDGVRDEEVWVMTGASESTVTGDAPEPVAPIVAISSSTKAEAPEPAVKKAESEK